LDNNTLYNEDVCVVLRTWLGREPLSETSRNNGWQSQMP